MPRVPELDQFEMGLELVRHARYHLDILSRALPTVMVGRDPGGGGITFEYREADPAALDPSSSLEVETKHCVEDLSSALEYLAIDIFERYCCRNPSSERSHLHGNVSFPAPKLADNLDVGRRAYRQKLIEVFPRIDTNKPALLDLLTSCYDEAVGEKVWLDSILTLWPEVKHRKLLRVATKPMDVYMGGRHLANLDVLYFPDSKRAVIPNLTAAIAGVERLIQSVRDLTTGGPSP